MARLTPGKLAKTRAWCEAQAETFRSRGDESRAAEYDQRAARCSDQLRSTNHCVRCGRTLTDPESVARGLGSDCVQLVAAS